MHMWPADHIGDVLLTASQQCWHLLALRGGDLQRTSSDAATKKALRLVDRTTRDAVDAETRRLSIGAAQLGHLAAMAHRFPLLSDLVTINSPPGSTSIAANIYHLHLLVSALPDPRRLTGLEVQGAALCNMHTTMALAEALSAVPGLTRLRLPDLTPALELESKAIISAAARLPLLEHLNLRRCNLGRAGSDEVLVHVLSVNKWPELQVIIIVRISIGITIAVCHSITRCHGLPCGSGSLQAWIVLLQWSLCKVQCHLIKAGCHARSQRSRALPGLGVLAGHKGTHLSISSLYYADCLLPMLTSCSVPLLKLATLQTPVPANCPASSLPLAVARHPHLWP